MEGGSVGGGGVTRGGTIVQDESTNVKSKRAEIKFPFSGKSLEGRI
jgi:hypothetical protein